jgi:hypothetical protein
MLEHYYVYSPLLRRALVKLYDLLRLDSNRGKYSLYSV